MTFSSLWNRCRGRYQRAAAAHLSRRPFPMGNEAPLISFTFDDFPRSALFTGGAILEEHGVRGTYYTSLGLMGKTAPTGRIFERDDLLLAIERGHELGCHSFAHCDAAETAAGVFEESILANDRALRELEPGVQLKTLSYPIGNPRPGTKKRCEKYFLGCRAGGQTFNCGTVDLNYLQAFFIEQCDGHVDPIQAVIDANCRAGGWLIFATHDVSDGHTRYGCRPAVLTEVVKRSIASGARVVPVSAGLAAIGAPDTLRR